MEAGGVPFPKAANGGGLASSFYHYQLQHAAPDPEPVGDEEDQPFELQVLEAALGEVTG